MKLDVNALRYLSKDDFRVLTAVEMGMRNVRFPNTLHRPRILLHVKSIAGFRDLRVCFFFLDLSQHEIVPAELVDRIAGLK